MHTVAAHACASYLLSALVTELHPSPFLPPPRPVQLKTVQIVSASLVHMAEAQEPVKVTADQLGVKEGCGTYALNRVVSPCAWLLLPPSWPDQGPSFRPHGGRARMPTGRSMTASWSWTWAT